MTPPNFSPRGGGQTVLCRFRYRPEDVVCKHCTEYRRGGCTEEVCPWLEERVEAGTVTYTSLAAEFYRKWLGTALGERIQELLRGKRSIAYYDSAHTDRLALYALFLARHRSDHRALAAMYLLTVTETLRRCAIPRIFDLWGIDIRSWSAVRTSAVWRLKFPTFRSLGRFCMRTRCSPRRPWPCWIPQRKTANSEPVC